MHRGEAHGAAACLAALAIAAGCGGGNSGSVTYYKDVLPIVVKHCGGCHAPGGLAPFSLMSYDDARGYAGPVAIATKSGSMPPWPPAPGCGEFLNTRRLSTAEIDAFAAWNDAGAPAGDPTDAPANLTPRRDEPRARPAPPWIRAWTTSRTVRSPTITTASSSIRA